MSIIAQKALRNGMRRAVDPIDYGSLHAMDAERKIPKAARRAERHQRPDPEDPNRTVWGCRRVEEFRRLEAAGSISLEHAMACERYILTAAAAEGANDQAKPIVGRLPPWMQGHPAEQQLMARVSLRNAINALGNSAHALVQMLVLENLTIKAIAARKEINPTEAKGEIRAALTRLAEHWGYLAPCHGDLPNKQEEMRKRLLQQF